MSGAIIPLCIGILRERTTHKQFGFGLGLLLSAHALGALGGLLIGGFIIDAHHWRTVFGTAAAAVIGLLGILLVVPSSKGAPQRLDWMGLGIAPIVAAFLFAISAINKPTLSPLMVGVILVVALALMALWVWHELRHDNPLVDLRALRTRNVAVANLTALFLTAGPAQIQLYVSLIVQKPVWTGIGFRRSASASGVVMAPMNTGAALLGPVAGLGVGRWGPRPVLLTGAVMLSFGWTVVAIFPKPFVFFVVVMFVCAWGAMITNVAMTSAITLATPPEKTGEAQGLLAISKSVGSAIGAQLVALLLSLSTVTSPDDHETFPDLAAHE